MRWVAKRWQNIRTGMWFFPALVALAFLLAAVGLTQLDRRLATADWPLAYDGDALAARDILVAIAGSVITVSGVVFSITIVTLQLVSSQFTPRALREFLDDRITQLIAGAFLGIVAYCLWVLRAVRIEGDAGEGFVPAVSLTVANMLGLVALALLIAFIHNIATTVQVSNIVERVHDATRRAIGALHPHEYGDRDAEPPHPPAGRPGEVEAGQAGYIQRLEVAEIVESGQLAHLHVELCVRPGDFVTERTTLARVWPAHAITREVSARLRAAFVSAAVRDIGQDPSFGLQQLADIAIRALSPAVNDPTTATVVVGYLQSALEDLAGRALPARERKASGDGPIVYRGCVPFRDYLREAFGNLAHHAARDARVAAALADACDAVMAVAHRAGATDRVAALTELARNVLDPALEAALSDSERDSLRERRRRLPVVAPLH